MKRQVPLFSIFLKTSSAEFLVLPTFVFLFILGWSSQNEEQYLSVYVRFNQRIQNRQIDSPICIGPFSYDMKNICRLIKFKETDCFKCYPHDCQNNSNFMEITANLTARNTGTENSTNMERLMKTNHTLFFDLEMKCQNYKKSLFLQWFVNYCERYTWPNDRKLQCPADSTTTETTSTQPTSKTMNQTTLTQQPTTKTTTKTTSTPPTTKTTTKTTLAPPTTKTTTRSTLTPPTTKTTPKTTLTQPITKTMTKTTLTQPKTINITSKTTLTPLTTKTTTKTTLTQPTTKTTTKNTLTSPATKKTTKTTLRQPTTINIMSKTTFTHKIKIAETKKAILLVNPITRTTTSINLRPSNESNFDIQILWISLGATAIVFILTVFIVFSQIRTKIAKFFRKSGNPDEVDNAYYYTDVSMGRREDQSAIDSVTYENVTPNVFVKELNYIELDFGVQKNSNLENAAAEINYTTLKQKSDIKGYVDSVIYAELQKC